MQEKNPFNYPVSTYMWVISLAATGGLIAALKREQSLKRTIVDILASALAGLLMFWLCEANGVNPLYAAIVTAISGHLGTKMLEQLGNWVSTRFLGTTSLPKAEDPHVAAPIQTEKNDDTHHDKN
jgi:hypothetical protein